MEIQQTIPAPDNKRILVAVAWPYAKTSTHVGQIVGSFLPGDIFARYHRLAGHEVLMVSGSDAHGTPITVDADREGVPPGELAARYHTQIVDVLDRLGVTFDLYTITTTENHYRVTQDVFLRLLEHGYLFKDTMESPYCPTDKRFLPDRYILGTCPYCGFTDARGDQCDNCGRTLDAKELINPRCKICGSVTSKIEFRETEHFFLDLPKLSEPLRIWLERNRDRWRPTVVNFAMNWITEGLRPRAITRDLDWGVPVPVPGYENKRIYVWFDAVIGYLSASIEWAALRGEPDAWKRWWELGPDGQEPSRSYYFVGKDNIPFHAIIWPAMLMGYGGLALPYDVPANEFMQMGGMKASSSRGNVIWTTDMLDRYGADTLRYYLTITMPETRDSDFTYDELVRRNNDELVATYGNAAHRTLTFAQRNFGAAVPEPGELTRADEEMLATVERGFAAVAEAIEAVRLRDALNEAMSVARAANRYLDEQAPWKSVKSDRAAAGRAVWTMLQTLNGLKTLFLPFTPFSSQKLHELLGNSGDVNAGGWTFQRLPVGQTLPSPAPLFVKFEPVEVEAAEAGE
ncbi:MAG TPA: methionine--tRNA ligase [Ktedonobacterales bacterium]|nr:methionine--tRNA ligase [Ktedonobacterales bacterium]